MHELMQNLIQASKTFKIWHASPLIYSVIDPTADFIDFKYCRTSLHLHHSYIALHCHSASISTRHPFTAQTRRSCWGSTACVVTQSYPCLGRRHSSRRPPILFPLLQSTASTFQVPSSPIFLFLLLTTVPSGISNSPCASLCIPGLPLAHHLALLRPTLQRQFRIPRLHRHTLANFAIRSFQESVT